MEVLSTFSVKQMLEVLKFAIQTWIYLDANFDEYKLAFNLVDVSPPKNQQAPNVVQFINPKGEQTRQIPLDNVLLIINEDITTPAAGCFAIHYAYDQLGRTLYYFVNTFHTVYQNKGNHHDTATPS